MQGCKETIPNSVLQRRSNGRSLDEYRQLKLLPHINEEYQFRITNKLLIQKISNPKRDRIIIDSLAHTSYPHFYKYKKGKSPHVNVTAYRRKIALTAARKNRQKTSDSQLQERIRLRGGEERSLFVSRQEMEGGGENEGQKMDGERQKNGSMAFSKSIQLRGNFAGKIVRNNCNNMMRLPKKAILRNNYYVNNQCLDQFHRDFSRQHPQNLIKKIARRIYQQEQLQKQNKNQ